MHMGDIAHNPVTSLQHPEWTPIFDYDPAQAINSRKAILDRVATDRVMAMGYHFPFAAIGHVVEHDKASMGSVAASASDPLGLVARDDISLEDAMSSKQERFRIAVLDDYQNVALSLADWSVLDARAMVTVFNDHLADSDAVVERLQPFDIVCVMRERTPMTRTIIERLPKLRLIASTASRNASIDLKAAEERGVQVVHTGYTSTPTIELTWALILGSARNLVAENTSLRSGGWQQSVGDDMAGRTLGVLGLGNVGGAVARIGHAFGMKVIAWSQNLTTERAAEVGATLVSKDELFQEADVVSIHLVLSGRTRGLVGAAELALMKPTARFVNTSRGPIVVEADLVAALKDKTIAGAAIDVFDQEPLPLDHPFRSLPNLLATPHIGYVSRGLYERFYRDTVENIARWLDRQAPV